MEASAGTNSLLAAFFASKSKSIVPTANCSARKPNNMNTLPPSVMMKNRNAARGAPGPPHRRISRYEGINVISQHRNHGTKCRAVKTPQSIASSTSTNAQ